MAGTRPKRISAKERANREHRVQAIAREVGFEGRTEYRHLYSQTGGAQFGLAEREQDDLLLVFAEAFDRDADPNDFSLRSIIAHERAHQLLARHPRLIRNLPRTWSNIAEEIAASIIGSLLVTEDSDRQALVLKALFEAIQAGLEPSRATTLVMELRGHLEKLL